MSTSTTSMIASEENSLLYKVAEYVWGNGKDDDSNLINNDSSTTTATTVMSPEICLDNFPLGTSYECWTQLLAKIMGVILILVSLMIKTPIIRNILKAQSAAGLSRNAVYGEVIVYSNSAIYGYLRGVPITAYGEYMALVIQAITILSLTWYFSGDRGMARITTKEKIIVIGLYTIYIIIATIILPKSKLYYLTSSSLPILLYARGSQIIKTYKNKQTGAQSIISTSMSLWGASTRVLTTIQEVGYDFGLLLPFCLGICLNSIVFTQYFLYYDNTKEFLQQLCIEKEKKKKA